MKTVLALVVVMVPLVAGCIDFSPQGKKYIDEIFPDPYVYPEEPGPMEYSYFRIGQLQFNGPPPGMYEGSLEYWYCIYNPNPFTVWFQSGWNVYQVMGAPNLGELRLVETNTANLSIGPEGKHYPGFPYHDIYYNETVEGNSTEYRIQYWHHVMLGPGDPVHYVEKWFDVTFKPYGPQETHHEEGEPCDDRVAGWD